MRNRRDFLRYAAGGAALCAVGAGQLTRAAEALQAAGLRQIPVGLQLYAVRGAFVADVAGTLRAVAEIGYHGVEFWGYGGEPTIQGKTGEELRAILDEVGLVCCGSHISKSALDDAYIAASITMAKTLGHTFLIIAGSEPDMVERDKVLRFAEFLNVKAKRAAEDGMRVGYHAHGFDFKMLGDKSAWEILFENTAPEVVMQLDVGNAMSGGGDPVKMLEKFPGRCASLHVKEYPWGPLGQGQADWKRIFNLCETKHQTEWYIVEQTEGDGTSYRLPKQAVEQFRAWGKIVD